MLAEGKRAMTAPLRGLKLAAERLLRMSLSSRCLRCLEEVAKGGTQPKLLKRTKKEISMDQKRIVRKMRDMKAFKGPLEARKEKKELDQSYRKTRPVKLSSRPICDSYIDLHTI